MGPIYESTFVVAEEARAKFEPWLRNLRDRAIGLDGIDDVRGFESEESPGTFTCRFLIADDPALDELQDTFFVDTDAALAEAFGSSVATHSRILREETAAPLPVADHPICLNCGTRLRGQYCGYCGQRARSRLISLWQLLREAFGDLLEFDSRLWRTIRPLLIKPGQLTRDYLEGRRARYMPPFRTYLVLSIVFFVVAFFDPRSDLAFLYEPTPEPTAEELAEQARLAEEAAAEREHELEEAREAMNELEAKGGVPAEIVAEIIDDDDEINISIGGSEGSDGGLFDDCDKWTLDDEADVPDWFRKRFTTERLKRVCERNQARGIDNLGAAITDKIPVSLIVLLPLMALVLKVLYPLSRRYFVEHLLFFIHFHAFVFLLLTLIVLFSRLVSALSIDGAITTLVIVAAWLYIPVYLYKALRQVYAQGHLITVAKYLLLFFAYTTGATLTMAGATAVAVFSA